MRLRLSAISMIIAVSTCLTACGSSTKAAGVQLAPSAGATADSTTPTTAATASSSTSTTATSTSTTPLPVALKTKPTVVVPTGPAPKTLVVKDLIKGTGPAATAASTVTVHYVGVLYMGGKQFDASWNDGSGQPLTFPLSGVIQGWQQGIPGMKVGGRRELIIPPGLAYQNRARPKIPANSTLVFVIDLHGVA